MSTDQIGIVVLVVLFAIGFALRGWYKDRAKKYLISQQFIGGSVLSVVEHNPEKPFSLIEISLTNVSLDKLAFGIETISKKRALQKFYFNDLELEKSQLTFDELHQTSAFFAHKKSLVTSLNNQNIKLFRFRFFVEAAPQKVFKSPELAFSTKGLLFKPDTGSYN